MSAKTIVKSIYPDAVCSYAPMINYYCATVAGREFRAGRACDAWTYAMAEMCDEKTCRALVRRRCPDAQITEYPDHGCKIVAVGLVDPYCHQTPLEAWRAAAEAVNGLWGR